MSLPQLTADRPFLTDGGLETTLVFHQGLDLPDFAAFPLLDSEEGRAGLVAYYTPYLDLAERLGTGFVLDTPTWRANLDWGARLGYDAVGLAAVNHRAVEFVTSLAAERPGCHGDRQRRGRPAGRRLRRRVDDVGRRSRRLPRPAGPRLRRGRRRDDVRHHDDLRRGGDRCGPGGRRRRPARRHLLHRGDRRPPAVGPDARRRHRPGGRRLPRRPRLLHGQLRPPDALLERARGRRTLAGAGPRRAGQRVAPEPRRARRGHRAGPRRHRRARRAVRRRWAR